jgi:hypothetical protein
LLGTDDSVLRDDHPGARYRAGRLPSSPANR